MWMWVNSWFSFLFQPQIIDLFTENRNRFDQCWTRVGRRFNRWLLCGQQFHRRSPATIRFRCVCECDSHNNYKSYRLRIIIMISNYLQNDHVFNYKCCSFPCRPKGYCFSASLPPLLAQACITALDKFQSSPEIFQEIRAVSLELHK